MITKQLITYHFNSEDKVQTKKINNIGYRLLDQDFIFYDLVLEILYDEMKRRSGFIYVMYSHEHSYYKVGMTKKTVEDRLKSLNSAGMFYHLEHLVSYPVWDVFIERMIHHDLLVIGGKQRKHKEFFNLPINLIENVITDNIYNNPFYTHYFNC